MEERRHKIRILEIYERVAPGVQRLHESGSSAGKHGTQMCDDSTDSRVTRSHGEVAGVAVTLCVKCNQEHMFIAAGNERESQVTASATLATTPSWLNKRPQCCTPPY